jgi:hypothetical protein
MFDRHLRLMPLVLRPVLVAECADRPGSREVAASGVAAVSERLSHQIAVSIHRQDQEWEGGAARAMITSGKVASPEIDAGRSEAFIP